MPTISESLISCGVKQLHGLCRNGDVFDREDGIPPKEIIYSAFTNWLDGDSETFLGDYIDPEDFTFGIVMFSDSTRRGNGQKLAAYITRYKLGTIIPSDIIINPNTGRDIQAWMWQLNIPALITWLEKTRAAAKKANSPNASRRTQLAQRPIERW